MKLCCCYTPSHADLFEYHFKPSLPSGFQLAAVRLDRLYTDGDFVGEGYLECLRLKIRLVVESLLAAGGNNEILVWSDVDILFLRSDVAEDLRRRMEESGVDVLFQRDGKSGRGVNGGFYGCRANARSLAFFRAVLAQLELRRDILDQTAINELLCAQQPMLRWDLLPFAYYARSQGWPPPRELMLYHANVTFGAGGVRKKVRQFEELLWIRRVGWPALAWTCLRYAPRRVKRLAATAVAFSLGT